MLGAMRPRQVLALFVAGLMGCNSVPPKHPQLDADVIRYRLLLRNNPVSSTDAAHCFVSCQASETPNAYVDCLSTCPGFEKTPGERCASYETPPDSACLTVRKVKMKNNEPPPGMVVLAIIGEIALVVGAASLCNISSTQCRLQQFPPPK
jgi:hypothetical protein